MLEKREFDDDEEECDDGNFLEGVGTVEEELDESSAQGKRVDGGLVAIVGVGLRGGVTQWSTAC